MLTTKHLALWLMAQVHITAARQVSQVGMANIEFIECLDRVTNIEFIECLDRVTNIVF